MIEIKCTKAQYNRLISCAKSYYENGKCFLGKSVYYNCFYYNKSSVVNACEECLKTHIKRVAPAESK